MKNKELIENFILKNTAKRRYSKGETSLLKIVV